MSNVTALCVDDTIQSQDMSTQAIMFDFSMIEKMNELAKMMSVSKVAVPAHFRGSPGDCLAVVMQAAQWGMNPFAVAQKTFCISGVMGYEAQLVNAVIAARAPVTGRIEYEWYGPWERVLGKFAVKKNGDGKEYRTPNWSAQDEEGCGVRVWATFKGEAKPRVLDLLLTQARTRNSTLWADDPRQQLAYLAVKRWARLYCPDVILGVYTSDELEERYPAERDMGAAEDISPRPAPQDAPAPAAAALPDYSQDAFARNLSAWATAIQTGKLTAEEVITRASTKGTLSEAQKARIYAAAQPKPEPEVIDAPAADADGWLKDYDAAEAQQ